MQVQIDKIQKASKKKGQTKKNRTLNLPTIMYTSNTGLIRTLFFFFVFSMYATIPYLPTHLPSTNPSLRHVN